MDPSATPPASARTSPPAAAPKPAYTAPTIPSHQQPAVTVQPGDSLWLIAAHRLGSAASTADVAAEWPRWYGANQAQIGPDPGELVPGQQLTVPASTPEVH
jgi:nucleoid-associated protein YgaU